MDYEDAAKKLVVFSRAFAKGSFSTAYGLSVGEMPVLEYLAGCPDGAIPSRMAKELGHTRSRMSRIIDSLAAKDYVVREADEADRRRVIVRITEKGRAHSDRKRADGVSQLSDVLSELGEHDVSELVRVLERAYSITYDSDPNSDSAQSLGTGDSSADRGSDSSGQPGYRLGGSKPSNAI